MDETASNQRGSGEGLERVARPDVVVGGRYRIETLLGKGGMGEVWQGRHLITQRPVAIKLLRRVLSCRPDMRRRFLRESRAAAAINHPNVVEVLDAFELEDGTPAIVMPLLEGRTLAALIDDDAPLSVDATLAILLPVVEAVAATHARGIVHRDLKPENVFLAREAGTTVVKVLDFGVAKLATDELDDGTSTAEGTLLGTPAYMAPEQALCEADQDHRVDIWAIGAIGYQLLSGCRPVEGENAAQVIKSLLTQALTPLQVLVPELPDVLNQTIMQMLRRTRSERPSLVEVLARLRPFLAMGSGIEGKALGAAYSLATPGQSLSLSERPSIGALAVYSTVQPPSNAGSTLRSPLTSKSSKGWQGLALVGAAFAAVVAFVSLIGARRSMSTSSALSRTIEAASGQSPRATVAPLAASTGGPIAPASASASALALASVAAAGSVRAPVVYPRQKGRQVRATPEAQTRASLDDKRPRPIDRANPFLSK